MDKWSPELEKVLSDLKDIKKQAHKTYCINHTVKTLRDWADRIEVGEISAWELDITPEYSYLVSGFPEFRRKVSHITTKFTVKEMIKND
jgi:hypothetical protein